MMVKGWQSQECRYKPEVFLTSMILFFWNFFDHHVPQEFQKCKHFPLLSDFTVVIALVVMTGIDMGLNTQTPKLQVSVSFTPTQTDKSWLIDIDGNPYVFLAIIPALLATILDFMDQQITVVIVNWKAYLLKALRWLVFISGKIANISIKLFVWYLQVVTIWTFLLWLSWL